METEVLKGRHDKEGEGNRDLASNMNTEASDTTENSSEFLSNDKKAYKCELPMKIL